MPKHYEDEMMQGERLRHYFKSDDYGFPSMYRSDRYPTKAAALRWLTGRREDQRRSEIRDSYSKLLWAEMEDLHRCPICHAVVEVSDLLEHHEWHDRIDRRLSAEVLGERDA